MEHYANPPPFRAEATASYRKLEVAYHELQAAQNHLRSTHSRLTHSRPNAQDSFHQELLRLANRVDRATSDYQGAMREYVEAACPESTSPSVSVPPTHAARLHTGLRP